MNFNFSLDSIYGYNELSEDSINSNNNNNNDYYCNDNENCNFI